MYKYTDPKMIRLFLFSQISIKIIDNIIKIRINTQKILNIIKKLIHTLTIFIII